MYNLVQLDDIRLTGRMSECEAGQDKPTYMSEFSKDICLSLNHFVTRIKLGLDHLDREEVSSRAVEAFVHRSKCPVSESG
jgi:hypothetical protein